MTLWIIGSLLFTGMISLTLAMIDILGGDYHADGER